jgi:predicted transcriptional regulator
MKVTTIKHAIALSDKEFALLETIHKLGPCNSEQVQDDLKDPDLINVMRTLHDLTARGLLVRPEIDEQLLYAVKANYAELRNRVIVMEFS